MNDPQTPEQGRRESDPFDDPEALEAVWNLRFPAHAAANDAANAAAKAKAAEKPVDKPAPPAP